MKIRVDVYVGDESKFDTEFLEKRKQWLPYTGIYLEFILKGMFEEQVDFRITPSDKESILVNKHSWNRFFLNIQGSGSVKFELLKGDKCLTEKTIEFDVVKIEVPLLFSLSNLFNHHISDIRFFANRLAENLNNGTRFVLFTTQHLEYLNQLDFEFKNAESHLRLCELVFSILTERGLTVFITPFSEEVPYLLKALPKYKNALLWYMEKSKKFRIVWDLSSGLRDKEMNSFVDSAVGRFGRDIPLVVSKNVFGKLGGEGFSYFKKEFELKEVIPQNERGIKIASYSSGKADYYALRRFAEQAVESGWGVEYICTDPGRSLHNIRYSFGRALYQGYLDARSKK
jgi:hypothetical protein